MRTPFTGPSWVVTSLDGTVKEASAESGSLFNFSARAMVGRSLYTFFDRDRQLLIVGARQASVMGETITLTGHLRPRDRKPFDVAIRVEPLTDDVIPRLKWTLGHAAA